MMAATGLRARRDCLSPPASRSALRLGLVIPRYGPDVLGGAEAFARHLAEHLPPEEFQVTVLTTCARDLSTWRNEFPAGRTQIGGIPVLRFTVDHRRDVRLFRLLTNRINRGEPLSPALQADWLDNSTHSPELYLHLATHGNDFDLLLLMPYLFGPTIFASTLFPEKTIVCPCLHDEPYAYFTDVRLMLGAVRGLMYVSEAERALTEEKLGVRHNRACFVGSGVEEFEADGDRFRRRFGLDGSFALYAGRLEPAKNILQLVSYFLADRQAQPQRDLKLVVAGSGPLALPPHPDIVAVGLLSTIDLHDAYAAAAVVCQPSLMESFSIVLMESWLAGTPVLVHGHCAVTRSHVQASNGGLYYSSASEFALALEWLLDRPEMRKRMGSAGRDYALANFGWPEVLDRFRSCVSHWLS